MFRTYIAPFAVLLTSFAPSALADTATLTITGRVLPGTCVLSVDAVNLPGIKASDLVEGDNSLQDSAVRLNSCVGVTRATLAFDGVEESSDPQRWKNTATSDAARGVSFSILKGTSGATYIKKSTSLDVTVSGAGSSQPIRVGYYKSPGQATSAGLMRAEITITASYQ